MKKVICTLLITFAFINIIRVIGGHQMLTTEVFMQVTESYFELNDIEDPVIDSMDKIQRVQDFTHMFNTEIIFEANNPIEGFFNYVMQVLGGVADIILFGLTWIWNITIGWIAKLLAYILTIFGFGKY